MAWLTTAVSSTIPWPKLEQQITFEGIEIDILPETEEAMPSVRINLRKHSINLEEGRVLLKKFFSSLSWSENGYIKEISSVHSSHKIPVLGKNLNNSITTSRLNDDYIPVALNDRQRLALALYREAQYLNSPPYKYLAYFKILNIQKESSKDQQAWINDNLSKLKNPKEFITVRKIAGD